MKMITFEEACKLPTAHFVLDTFGLTFNGKLNNKAISELPEDKKELYALGIQLWEADHLEGGEVCATLWQLIVPTGKIYKGGLNPDKNDAKYDVARKDTILKRGIIKHKGKETYATVELKEFLKVNSDYENSGRFYEFHDKETELAKAIIKKDIADRLERQRQEEITAAAFKGGVAAMASGAAPKSPEPPKAKKIWIVDIDMNLDEYKGKEEEFDPDDYLASGTKAHCQKYLKDEEAKSKK